MPYLGERLLEPVERLAALLRPRLDEHHVAIVFCITADVLDDVELVVMNAGALRELRIQRGNISADTVARAALFNDQHLGALFRGSSRRKGAAAAVADHQHIHVDGFRDFAVLDHGLLPQPVLGVVGGLGLSLLVERLSSVLRLRDAVRHGAAGTGKGDVGGRAGHGVHSLLLHNGLGVFSRRNATNGRGIARGVHGAGRDGMLAEGHDHRDVIGVALRSGRVGAGV